MVKLDSDTSIPDPVKAIEKPIQINSLLSRGNELAMIIRSDDSYGGRERGEAQVQAKKLSVGDKIDFIDALEKSERGNFDAHYALSLLENDDKTGALDTASLPVSERDNRCLYDAVFNFVEKYLHEMDSKNQYDDIRRVLKYLSLMADIGSLPQGYKLNIAKIASHRVEGMSPEMVKMRSDLFDNLPLEVVKLVALPDEESDHVIYSPEFSFLDATQIEIIEQDKAREDESSLLNNWKNRIASYIHEEIRYSSDDEGEFYKRLDNIWNKVTNKSTDSSVRYLVEQYGDSLPKMVAAYFAQNSQYVIEAHQKYNQKYPEYVFDKDKYQGDAEFVGDIVEAYSRKNIIIDYENRNVIYAMLATNIEVMRHLKSNKPVVDKLVLASRQGLDIVSHAFKTRNIPLDDELAPSVFDVDSDKYIVVPKIITINTAHAFYSGRVALSVEMGSEGSIAPVTFAHEYMHLYKNRRHSADYDSFLPSYEEPLARLYESWLKYCNGLIPKLEPEIFDEAIRNIDVYARGAKKLLELLISSGEDPIDMIPKIVLLPSGDDWKYLRELCGKMNIEFDKYMSSENDSSIRRKIRPTF
jgi:hypothetical protein